MRQINAVSNPRSSQSARVSVRAAGTEHRGRRVGSEGTSFVWEFSIAISSAVFLPKGKSLELLLRAHFSSTESLVELARVTVTGITSQLNTSTPAVLALSANLVPRLSVGINNATPNDPGTSYDARTPTLQRGAGAEANAGTGSAQDLSAGLFRVFVLLDNPITFDPLWDSQTNDRTLFSLAPSIVSRDPIRTAEELWARQVTEMLAFTPYGGPSGTYGLSRESQFISQGLANADPRYSVTYACQQLASFALASRGVQFPQLQNGDDLMLNAGSTSAKTYASAPVNGQWFTFSGETPKQVAAPNGTPQQLGGNIPTTGAAFFGAGTGVAPGSVFLFANRAPTHDPTAFVAGAGCVTTDLGHGPVEFCVKTDKGGEVSPVISKINKGGLLADNTGNAHIGFVLRTDPRLQVFQTFDTGGLGVPGRSTGVTVFPVGSGFHSGNFDDPAGVTIKGGDPFRGMGNLPAPTVSSAQSLESRVKTVLRNAFPLGFARFVLISRGAQPSNVEFKPGNVRQLILKQRLMYASPMLRMNGPAADQNYAISRYLWSLRDFPARSNVEAWWFLYIPQGELAVATLASARTDSVITIAQAAFKKMSRDRQNNFLLSVAGSQNATPDFEKVLRRLTTPALDCTVTTVGASLVTATLRSPQNLHPLHSLEAQAPSTSAKLPNLPMLDTFPTLPNGLPPYFNG